MGDSDPMDASSGEPWSEMDIADLTHSLAHGDTSRPMGKERRAALFHGREGLWSRQRPNR